jgi:hypothetical protein
MNNYPNGFLFKHKRTLTEYDEDENGGPESDEKLHPETTPPSPLAENARGRSKVVRDGAERRGTVLQLVQTRTAFVEPHNVLSHRVGHVSDLGLHSDKTENTNT